MPDPAPLLLVDAHALAYRSFHAIRSLSSPSGAPTNAIFGFVKTIHRLLDQLQPALLAVVWDGGLAPARLTLLPAYKAQRPPMPPALAQQLTALPDWLDASGFASLCQDGVEADDWIAALALAAIEAGTPAVIFSPDKDFLQLVSPAIRLLIPGDKSGHLWDEADVRAKTGVAPNQIVDWLSLVGDTVDNIPGIPGVGPKTAASLLAQFGSCDRLLDHLDEVPSDRIRNAIRDGQASLERNREMIRLRADLPPACPLARLSLRSPDPARLAALYRQWGFRGLLASVSSENSGQATFGF